jgi:hypothetical protein
MSLLSCSTEIEKDVERVAPGAFFCVRFLSFGILSFGMMCSKWWGREGGGHKTLSALFLNLSIFPLTLSGVIASTRN